MGVSKAKDLITETKVKIMELPYFEEKVEIVSALLDLEWKIKEEIQPIKYSYEEEMAEEISSPWEHPWST